VSVALVSAAGEHELSDTLSAWVNGDAQRAVMIPVDAISTGDSPRLAGEDPEHVRVLTESDEILPPIIVHRKSMRVIDGAHRWRAAVARGDSQIAVLFFEGDDRAAFVLSVEANVAHGLPLSLADRRAAAERIIESYPEWSDRAVAAVAGLSHKTVGALRRQRPSGNVPQLRARVGRDGRLRPVAGAVGRRTAGEYLAGHPNASLREVARAAGISLTTARDVRERLRRGEPAELPQQRAAAATKAVPRPTTDLAAIVETLCRDPSLRQSEAGRSLLRLAAATVSGRPELPRMAEHVPAHCADMLADLALRCSVAWREFADQLADRRPRD
jgi:ParB-like chromosome segregation protein Spo0J